ncbi:hypothetical protein MNBD_ALPHA09-1295 [hydrothermal vent metagenome]|uniref:YjiS-like domain-containing protein n=1 Tax=hydrothermal vent metagenome TaxID=652676 RepID=A0A3B0U7P4_9ZZZZ
MFGKFIADLAHLVEVHRSRRKLAALSDDRLRDLGITRRQAELEAGRLPWDSDGFQKICKFGSKITRTHFSRR